MIFKLYFLLFLCFMANVDCKKFRYDYVFYPRIEGWLKHHQIPTTWFEARLRCHLEGAELASPLDDNLVETLESQIKTTTWTGVNSQFSKGDYYSIGGVPMLKMPIKWAPGEPNNNEDKEQCIAIMPNATFADVRCDELFPYFCYKKNSFATIMNPCGTTDLGYLYEARTGSCYKFHNNIQPWSRAFMICAAEGGHLAIMDTAIETQVLKELLSKYPANKIYGSTDYKDDAFVGIHDWNIRMWTTIHGQSLDNLINTGVITWDNEQPNNLNRGFLPGQSCGSITREGNLNDFWCDVPAAFICEKTPDSLEEYNYEM